MRKINYVCIYFLRCVYFHNNIYCRIMCNMKRILVKWEMPLDFYISSVSKLITVDLYLLCFTFPYHQICF
uniref:Uncharacterized protein n=1 Tax=Octopus bimaculoides TaxID=37653 RepID=A0A0L8HXP9_OCTBM